MGGGPEYATNGTRIGEDGVSSITWNVACDVSETGWVKSVQAIISVDCQSGSHTPPSASLQLRWKNFTDNPGGSFATLVTGSGELRGGASAGAISNTDPIGDVQNCPSDVVDASEEVENESPLQSASLSASQEDQIETQWCVDMSNALDGKEYQFELYNATEPESCGTCTPTITIFAEAPAEADELADEIGRQVQASMDAGQMIGLGRMGRLYRIG